MTSHYTTDCILQIDVATSIVTVCGHLEGSTLAFCPATMVGFFGDKCDHIYMGWWLAMLSAKAG